MSEKTAIAFAKEGEAAKINYSIPMPGAHTGKRVTEINLNFTEKELFQPDTFNLGKKLSEIIGATKDNNGSIRIDENKAKHFFDKQFNSKKILSSTLALNNTLNPSTIVPHINTNSLTENQLLRNTAETIYPSYESNIKNEEVLVATYTWAGVLTLIPTPLFVNPEPKFFIIEKYGISSFLGDYGMGRTVKTFTLLPGESTTISLKTWQSTKESRNESSSIIDSHEQSARERFADKVQNETTDKSTKSKTEKWHAEAEVKASWGWGSAKVSGGGSGEYHSGREQFAKQAAESVKEHASEASSKRELSVTSNSERTSESGSESIIERTISNVNVRRVLNFVFRELNQTYITKLHLKDIRIGFTNGNPNTWREVPISGLLPLLKKTVKPSLVDTIAQQILRAAGTVYDHNDTAIPVLHQVTLSSKGDKSTVKSASRNADGDFAPPTDDMYYRFKPGSLAQENQSNPVDGVLLNEAEITMKTDSVVVEALLGQADALDNYAMEIQEAAASKETLANKREELIIDTLKAIDDPIKRAELGALLLGICCTKDN